MTQPPPKKYKMTSLFSTTTFAIDIVFQFVCHTFNDLGQMKQVCFLWNQIAKKSKYGLVLQHVPAVHIPPQCLQSIQNAHFSSNENWFCRTHEQEVVELISKLIHLQSLFIDHLDFKFRSFYMHRSLQSLTLCNLFLTAPEMISISNIHSLVYLKLDGIRGLNSQSFYLLSTLRNLVSFTLERCQIDNGDYAKNFDIPASWPKLSTLILKTCTMNSSLFFYSYIVKMLFGPHIENLFIHNTNFSFSDENPRKIFLQSIPSLPKLRFFSIIGVFSDVFICEKDILNVFSRWPRLEEFDVTMLSDSSTITNLKSALTSLFEFTIVNKSYLSNLSNIHSFVATKSFSETTNLTNK